eukprot:6005606-Pyramimonas_sp.AAC.1
MSVTSRSAEQHIVQHDGHDPQESGPGQGRLPSSSTATRVSRGRNTEDEMSEDGSPSGVPIGNREHTPDPHGRNGTTARSRRGAFSSLFAESTESISPIPIATHTFVPAAGKASRSGEACESTGVYPNVPGGWGGTSGNVLIPIALNGQFGQD